MKPANLERSALIALTLLGALLACARSSVLGAPAPAEYRLPDPAVPPGVEPSARGGTIVGVVSSTCKGQALPAAQVRVIAQSNDTTSVQTNESGGFAVGPLVPGQYEIQVRVIAHEPVRRSVVLARSRVDTLRVVLKYNDSLVIADCIGPDGRSFGSQFCPPKQPHDC